MEPVSPVKRGRGRPPGSRTRPPQPPDPNTPLGPTVLAGQGLCDLATAAKYLGGVCTHTVRNMIRKKELPARKVGRFVMIPWVALRAYAGEMHADL